MLFGPKEEDAEKDEVTIPGENRDVESPMTPTMGTDPNFEALSHVAMLHISPLHVSLHVSLQMQRHSGAQR